MPGVTVVDMGLCLLKSDFLSFNKKGRKKDSLKICWQTFNSISGLLEFFLNSEAEALNTIYSNIRHLGKDEASLQVNTKCSVAQPRPGSRCVSETGLQPADGSQGPCVYQIDCCSSATGIFLSRKLAWLAWREFL